ncbi:hypothetical protein pah_c004o293 [Parachlamydia acanthamoebae str. Hall's coccus]|nr:hypothetical protein pah_c004o293 [Parachlamydia acanthamoebae str. Hall's coccus]
MFRNFDGEEILMTISYAEATTFIKPISHAQAPHFSEKGQVEQYANNSTYQWDGAMKIFELFRFNGTERVLDLGCGDGKVTDHLCQHRTKNHVRGIDISEKMIERASQSYFNPRLTFRVADMTNFSTEEKYDVVHAGYSLHYGDAEKALICMLRCLKPGGAALITLPGKFDSSLAVHSDRLSRSEKWKNDFREFKSTRTYYNSREFSELLYKVGFIPKHVETILQKVEFSDQDAIEAYYLPVSAHAHYLPEFQRADFISDLISLVLSENYEIEATEKPFIYQNKLEVIAIKPSSECCALFTDK